MTLQYKLSRRKTKKGFTYTASFRRNDGSFTSYLSLDTCSEKEAHQKVAECILENRHFITSDVTFRQFSESFFSWEGDWAKQKRSLFLRISREHCCRQQSNPNNHIIPFLGQLKLREISKPVIDKFRVHLSEKGLAAGTINHILISLKAILNSALDQGILPMVPKIRRVSNDTIEKGILTVTEISALCELNWKDKRSKVATLIGHFCGYRQGEILGIRLCDIASGLITIMGAWSDFRNRTYLGTISSRFPQSETTPLPSEFPGRSRNPLSSFGYRSRVRHGFLDRIR